MTTRENTVYCRMSTVLSSYYENNLVVQTYHLFFHQLAEDEEKDLQKFIAVYEGHLLQGVCARDAS